MSIQIELYRGHKHSSGSKGCKPLRDFLIFRSPSTREIMKSKLIPTQASPTTIVSMTLKFLKKIEEWYIPLNIVSRCEDILL